MKLLAIDTSTELATVALMVGQDISCAEQTNPRSHAQFILPMIDKLLAEAQMSLGQLEAIVFGCGPGSFTGLRIACSVAKGLAFAHDLGLIPVSTLSSIVYQAREQLQEEKPILAVIDARMRELYWGYYLNGQLIACEQVSPAEQIQISPGSDVVMAGVGIDLYWQDFSSTLKSHICSSLSIYPHARAMLNLAKREGLTPIMAQEAQPVYIRNNVTQGGSGG